MEFIRLKRFDYRPNSTSAKPGLQARTEHRSADKCRVTTFRYCNIDQTMSVGLSNGQVAQFCSPRFNQKKLTQAKDYEIRTYGHILNPHKGQIRCLLYEKIFEQWYMITGSSDRTIKLWDADPKTKDVAQTIVGHGGTVVALAYSQQNDTLFSSSNDKTIRIWKQQKHRNFFMHPWYVCYQIIQQLSNKRVEHPLYASSFELKDGEKDKFLLFVGDSEGSLHQICLREQRDKDSKSDHPRPVFVLEKSNFSYHRLTIHKMLSVRRENILFTLSFDQTATGYEELTEKQFFKFRNPRKQLFTACAWIDGIFVLADQSGCLYFAEINTEKQIEELQKYDCRIIGMQYLRASDELLIATESFIDVVKIKRGVKSGEGNSHTEAIVAIYGLEPYKVTNHKVKDSPKLVTVSLDNTMRVWDPQDLTCFAVLDNPQNSEISSLWYLQHANLFATGHENGAVRLWNIELGNSITIDQSQNPIRHNNSVCALSSYIYERGTEDITEYMFSAGYEGKINVWEIFEKKNIVQSSLMSSTICPQLKHSFFADSQQKIPDKIGQEILALAIYQERDRPKHDPDISRYIIAAGNSGRIYFIRMFTYEHQQPINAHSDAINTLLIDENILFSGSHDQTIKLWSLEDHSLLTYLNAGESGVRSLMIIQETGHLISNSYDGEVCCWDYPNKVIVKSFTEKNEKIQSVSYVNELKTMYVGTLQANIYTHSIADLYDQVVVGEVVQTQRLPTPEQANDRLFEEFLRRNQQELDKLNSKK